MEFSKAAFGPGIGQLSLGFEHIDLVSGRINFRDDLVGFDDRVVVHEEFLDYAGDLAADLDVDDRTDLTGRGDHLGQIPARDRHGLILRGGVAPAGEVPGAAANEAAKED